jgi:hypothetical protein
MGAGAFHCKKAPALLTIQSHQNSRYLLVIENEYSQTLVPSCAKEGTGIGDNSVASKSYVLGRRRLHSFLILVKWHLHR